MLAKILLSIMFALHTKMSFVGVLSFCVFAPSSAARLFLGTIFITVFGTLTVLITVFGTCFLTIFLTICFVVPPAGAASERLSPTKLSSI